LTFSYNVLYYNCSKGKSNKDRHSPKEKKVSRGASGDANRNRKAVKNSTISSATKKFFKEMLKNPLTTNADHDIINTESKEQALRTPKKNSEKNLKKVKKRG